MGVEPETPPKDIDDRVARVQTGSGSENTIEVPFDPFDPNFSRYFDQGAGMRSVTPRNKVKAFISGSEAFEAMADAIQTADSASHYIYMLNWFVNLDVPIKGGAALGGFLGVAEANGVQIRGMFWDQVFLQNNKAVDLLNNVKVFPLAAAILDNNTINNFPIIPASLMALASPLGGIGFFIARFLPGSHHQKVLVVKGREGLIAFVGGVDFNPDRIQAVSSQPGSPMHDVHCRIEGPAAHDVLQVFIDRWQDHPDSKKVTPVALRGLNEPVPPAKGDHFVQIGCTFGSGIHHAGIKNATGGNFYSFAPQGDRSAQRLIEMAILRSERFIYIEDQYLVNEAAAIALKVAADGVKRIIILIPHSSISDHPHAWKMRKTFVTILFDGLSADQRKKIVICYRKRFGDAPTPKKIDPNIPESYVHAKMMIVDDKFAMIGSANCGQRSYSNDSEIVAGIYDTSQDKPGAIHFAHALRIRLWAKHLGLPEREVFDPIASAVHWLKPSNASGIGIYDPDADTDSFLSPNNIPSQSQAEPFGGVPGKELSP